MGYETTYGGTIKMDEDSIKKLQEELDKGDSKLERYFEIDGVELEDDCISICGYGKIYDKELENLCLFLAKFDKGAVGEIECSGEDNADFWKIDVSGGEMYLRNGKIVYEGGEEYSDNNINKDVYEITKDKELLKEIIVGELEDG